MTPNTSLPQLSPSVGDLQTLLHGGNLLFAEALYDAWLADPASVSADWQAAFAALQRQASRPDVAAAPPVALPAAKLPTGDRAARVALLRGWAPFRELEEDALALVAEAGEELTLAAGTTLYREGDPGDSMYFVASGALTISRAGQLLHTLQAGQVSSELSLFFGQARTADASAEVAVRLLELRRDRFDAVLDRAGPLARQMLHLVSARLVEANARQERVDMLIRGYRVRGHVMASLDPLGTQPASHPELELAYYGLDESDLDTPFSCRSMSGAPILTLRQIITRLRNTYCGSIGVQYMHIDDPDVKDWLQAAMETTENRLELSHDEQVRIFAKLAEAEVFENFLQKKFVGAKRFSLEGGESLIPLLDMALEAAAGHGVVEAVIGMAHRGRLNVLANIMGKDPRQIFREFEDKDPDAQLGRGDVKYHMGFTNYRQGKNGQRLKLQLCFNPSHLEFVGPVAVGRVRGRQDRLGDVEHRKVMPILIHGDAAFAGQGVVQELLNMSELPGYSVGGTVHILVNNQIGFTTPPESSRSSRYATDVAKMLQVPIFHVNGEHPEGVAQVIRLALDFRARFQRDVVIDMYCYRRHGHNEGDDPTFTQPLMYQAIRARKSVVEGYLDSLLRLGGLSRKQADEIVFRAQQKLEEELSAARNDAKTQRNDTNPDSPWHHYQGGSDRGVPEADTAVPAERLTALMQQLTSDPANFAVHPKLARFLGGRREMGEGKKPFDWGAAETLAFATLVTEGRRVRLSGQDAGRGTFTHRHAVLHDYQTGAMHIPLQHLSADQAPFEVWDSPLSEVGVLGFDYGYSLDQPEALVIWEAQFGDFSNCAQVIIDQFISSSEDKWNRLSGVTLLLPHGFEGQGPEHSSARLERYLQLAAEDNIQVMNLTTPANLFHCLRRQVIRKIRKPMIVMSPKSLLRHPEAISDLSELASGGFQRVIDDPTVEKSRCKRVVLCTGKVYYDLLAERRARELEGQVALIRLEQLYPLPEPELQAALAGIPEATPVFWVQEEPANMGAWTFLRVRLGERLFGKQPLFGVSRPESASPATGSHNAHKIEQARLLEDAFTLAP